MMTDGFTSRLTAMAACLIGLAASVAQGQIAGPPAAPPLAMVPPQAPVFEDTCFLNWQTDGRLNLEQARRLLAEVQKQAFELTQEEKPHGPSPVTFTGLARLRAAWAEDSVLRFMVQTSHPFRLHFWGPQGGVVLGRFRNQQRFCWAAFGTSRRPGSPPPEGREPSAEDLGMALLATDDQRAGGGPAPSCQVRWQAGSLVMTTGDFRLLTVPMELPREVYFEGQTAMLHQLVMGRGGPVPDDPVAPPKLVLNGTQPAALPWSESPDGGGHLRRLPNGGIELTVKDEADSPAWVTMPLVRPGLYEVIFQLDSPLPDSGVFVADSLGRPIQGVEFCRDKATGLTAFRFGKPGASFPAAVRKQQKNVSLPGPYIGQRAWLKLVLGGGLLKCWVSADGLHWGDALPPVVQSGELARVGLFCQPGGPGRHIGLRRLMIRQLDALAQLAPVELQEQAEDCAISRPNDDLPDLATWQVRALELAPAGADPASWRIACALATLTHGPEPPLAKALVEELLRAGLAAPAPLAARLRLLHQATLLYDARASNDAQRLAAHWDRLGSALLREGNMVEIESLRCARMTASPGPGVEPFTAPFACEYLLSLISRGQWIEADRLCMQLRFWNQPANPRGRWSSPQTRVEAVVQWLEPLREKVAKRDRVQAPIDAFWRHPVSVEIGKEAFNVVTDLQIALDEGDYKQAFRVLSSSSFPAETGLVADAKDPRRFESLATAVGRMVRSHPRLQRTLNESLGSLDNFRVNRAMAEGDVARVRSIAIQYHGTPAAAEALRWLGDRLMGDGEFAGATRCYEEALPVASAAQRRQLEARLRLTGAMRGRCVGEPVTQSVRLGDMEIPAAEFEQLVAEMLQEHSVAAAAANAPGPPAPTANAPSTLMSFGPGRYRAESRAMIECDWGAGPQNAPAPSQQVDWQARQLAVVPQAAGLPDVMLAANRFQVTAVDLKSGSSRWSYSVGTAQGPAHAWPLVPMRPLVWGRRVYVRLLGQNGRPSLFCLDLGTGKLQWKAQYSGEVASDPVVIQDRLLVLTADEPEQPLGMLMLANFDPESGSFLGRTPLVQIGSQWTTQHACQVATGDKLLVAVAGSLLCWDPHKDMLWVRRSPWLPPAVDDTWPRQYHRPPIVQNDRAYVTQVGCRTVECVDVETGRLHWQRFLPGIRRILAAVNDRVLVEADERLLALSAETGQTLWSHEAPNLLDCHAQPGSGALLYVRNEPLPNSQWCPVLVWVDLKSGQTAGRFALTNLRGKQPRMGLFVAAGPRLFCFTGVFDQPGQVAAKREIMELVADGPQAAEPASVPDLWNAQVDPGWRVPMEKLLPGWTMLAGTADQRTGLLGLSKTKDGDLVLEQPGASPAANTPVSAPGAGVEDVIVTRAAEFPVRLARQLAIPEGKPQLVIEMGHAPDNSSRLEVMIDGIRRQSWLSQPTRTERDWQKVQVDLSSMAGRTVWVLITQEKTSGGAAYAYFKKIGLQQTPKIAP